MLLDNKSHGTVADVFRESLQSKAALSLLTSRFSLYAFAALRSELGSVSATRLLLARTQLSFDSTSNSLRVDGLQGESVDRRARNSLQSPAWARSCADWLRSNAEVKTISVPVAQNLIHVRPENSVDTAIQGSSTFTTGGLGLAPSPGYEMNTCFTTPAETDNG